MLLKDYPRQFVIRDSLWDVKFVQKLDGKLTAGLCDPSCQTIYVRLGQTKIERLKTVIHELLHAMEHEYAITIPHKMVYTLEAPLAEFLLDNQLVG